jgi:hypothetical protein
MFVALILVFFALPMTKLLFLSATRGWNARPCCGVYTAARNAAVVVEKITNPPPPPPPHIL